MRILAIDIGYYSIKAVELESSFGRLELINYIIESFKETDKKSDDHEPALNAQQAATQNENQPKEKKKEPKRKVLTDSQLAALKKIKSEHSFKYEKCVINFPNTYVTNRLYQFPTKDRKIIQSSLEFELEDDIPFAAEDIIKDFAIIRSDSTISHIFTAIILKRDMVQFLSELQMIGFDPDTVTIDSWAQSQLLKKAPPKGFESKPLAILNIGSIESSVCIYSNAEPVLTHICPCGGDHITRAISSHYHIPLTDAENAKVDGAFLLTQLHLENNPSDISEDQKVFSNVIEEAIAPLIREVKQTLISFKTKNKSGPRGIFVTGGTALIPNFTLYLEETLQLPVYHYSYISHIVGSSLKLSENSEAQISNAVGLALSIIKPDRNSTINFRKDEFSKTGGSGGLNLKQFKKVFITAAAVLAFIYTNLIIQYFILSSRSEKQSAQMERAIKSVFSTISSSTISTYMSSPSTLKSAVEKEIAKYKKNQTVIVKSGPNSLEILKKVSSSIPSDMVLDVSQFEIKDGKFKMKGTVNEMINVDRILKGLQDSKPLTDIAKGKMEEDKKKNIVNFEFTAKVADSSQPAEATNVKTR